MASDSLKKKLAIDPSKTPAIAPIVPSPRRVMMGTDVHKVRVESVILPESPWSSSTPPNNQIWLTGVNGQPILHIEKPEPVYLKGAPGHQESGKRSYGLGDWRNQHSALRAKNLIRRSSRGTPPASALASDANEVNSDAFQQEPAPLEKPSTVTMPKDVYRGQSSDDLRSMINREGFEAISPTPLCNPAKVVEASIRERRRLSNSTILTRASVGCPGCDKCVQDGVQDSTEDVVPDTSQHQHNYARYLKDKYPEDEFTEHRYFYHPFWKGELPACLCRKESKLPEEDIVEVWEPANPPGWKKKGPRIRLLGKSYLTALTDRKEPKMIDLEERNEADVPRDRHYEGCILCSPNPSPSSSVTGGSEGKGKGLFAPSGQDPGPPPLTPPPPPSALTNEDCILPSKIPIFPASFNPIKHLLGQEIVAGSFAPTPKNPPEREDLGRYAFYKDHDEGDGGYCRSFVPDAHSSQSSIGSVENLTGASNHYGASRSGKKRHMGWGNRNSNKNPDESGNSNSKKPPLLCLFPESTASSCDKGIKRLPFSNLPTFYGTPIRLPDNLNEGPHPGSRLDHLFLGADGVYEMVDFNNEYPENNGMQLYVRTPEIPTRWKLFKEKVKGSLVAMPHKFHNHPAVIFYHKWTAMVFLITGLTLATVIVVILVFMMPALIRNKVKDASIKINLLRMTDISNNFTSFEVDLAINSDANIRTSLKPTVLTFTANEEGNRHFLDGNIKHLGPEVGNAPVGYMWLNETVLPRGNGNLTLKGSSKADKFEPGADWTDSLADMVAGLIWGAYYKEIGMNVAIEGDVYVQAQGYTSLVAVHKDLVIPSMGGFQDLKIDLYELLQPQDGFMKAYLTWFNPSNIWINLGDVEFKLLFGGFVIGNATITSLEIVPGNNRAFLSSSLFENSPLRNNRSLLGKFISSLSIQESGLEDEMMLRLEGYNTTLNGFEIPWLLPTIRAFTKNLPISNKPLIRTGVMTNARIAMDKNNSSQFTANINGAIDLPFESKDFLTSVKGVGYTLKVHLPSLDDRELYHIQSNFGARGATFLPDAHNTISMLVESSWSCEWTFREIFMPQFIKSKTIPMKLTGSMTANVSTPLGDGYISGVHIKNQTWEFNGLDGLDGGGKERIVVANWTMTGRYWGVILQIHNPSDMLLNFGATKFKVFEGNTLGCFGEIHVDELNLGYGYNYIEGTLDLTRNCNSQNTAGFLSSYLAGGRNEFVLGITSEHGVAGLTGLKVGATWVSPGYKLIEFVEIFINNDNVVANIKLATSFPGIPALDSVGMEFILTDDTIIAATRQGTPGERVVVGDSRMLSGLTLTPMMSLQRFKEILGGGMFDGVPTTPVTVGWSIGLIWADYEAPVIRYTQEDVVIKLNLEG